MLAAASAQQGGRRGGRRPAGGSVRKLTWGRIIIQRSAPRACFPPPSTTPSCPFLTALSRAPLQRGFTLIELMVVLVIIGVLAALIVPNVIERADDARVTAARTDVNNLMQALKLYRLDNQRYPTAEQGLQALLTRPDHRPGRAQLEALRREAAERPVGPALPVPEPGHQGRDRRVLARRRRPARRRGQECRHRQLAVGASLSPVPTGARRRRRRRLHAARTAGGDRDHRDRHRRRRARAARHRPGSAGARSRAACGPARSGARAVARQRRRGALARHAAEAATSASTACRPAPCPPTGLPPASRAQPHDGRRLAVAARCSSGPEPIIAAQQVLLTAEGPPARSLRIAHRWPAALRGG